MIVDYIDSQRESYGVEPICEVLAEAGIAIAPSTYYAHKALPISATALEEAYLVNALVTLWEENWGVYGARKLWHAARRAGFDVGRDQVARLMKIAGITGAIRGRHRTRTTVRDETAPRHPDHVKRGWDVPTSTDQLWMADVTYVWTLTGFIYVAFIVDVYSRRILGWRVSTSKEASLVTDALRQALDVRLRTHVNWTATGLIHHSDAGSQYTSLALSTELLDAGISGSIGTVGDALDNALCESTIGLFKTEAINLAGPSGPGRREVEWQVARWVQWYNTTRLHSSIGHIPPIEFEDVHRQTTTQAPHAEVA